jgi:predicted DNA binding CopG/RHH family protein
MPKTAYETKDALVCTRVTPYIREILDQQASREGLTLSEWIRNLIVTELKSEGLLQMVFKTPQPR